MTAIQGKSAAWRSTAVILFAGMLFLALNMGLRQTFGLFIEPITADIGISHSSLSLAIAVQNLLWGLLTPFAGMAADRYGTGRVLALGGIVYVGGLAVMALATNPFMIHLGAGVLTGIAISATGFPLVLAAVARSVPEDKRSLALGIAAAGGSVGQFILLPVSQVLIGGIGWSMALFALAAMAALMVPMAAILAGKPVESAGETQSLGAAVVEAGGHRGFILLTLGFFVCGFHVAFVATHLPGYVVSCNLDAIVGANALGIIGFFNIIGTFAGGWLGGRIRKKYLLSSIYLARAVIIGVFLLGPKTEAAVYLFSGAFGLLWLSTVPLTSALVGQIFGPRYMATLFGIVMLSHQVGAFFGAWLGGVNVDLTGGYDFVWLAAVGLGLLAAMLHMPIADKPVERLRAAQA
ncbi:MAG: MFS transporter [Rhodovibrionaceae bacterium]|nr:MFS transporter [Rhodovibrionaceae bacterium]